jgi:hypothetical protein
MSSARPTSMGRPAYMTSSRSAIPATTPRSWVISTSDEPVSSRAARSASSTCAWIVMSSAVVGSSAMIRSGSLAIAIAMTTRCRMPPENSCGNDFARSLACGMPTTSRSCTARRIAASRLVFWCTHTASAICHPTVKEGLSELSGSCGIHAITLPRIAPRLRSLMPTSSVPRHRIEPATCVPLGRSPSTACAIVDLPEPDSPTMPMLSPRSTTRSTPRTARTNPASVGKPTVRPETSSTGGAGVMSAGAGAGPARPGARRR